MARSFEQLNDDHIKFIKAQKMFMVATAPLDPNGHVNTSPKGYDSLRILDRKTIAYLDMGGSGIETLAHLKENGRITLMFMAFEGKANILRVYGRGEAVSFDEPGFEEKLALFPNFERARSIMTIDIHRVADSCGFGVPFYEFKSERDQLKRAIDHKTLEDWKAHRLNTNAASIDGLEGLNPKSAK
ncbi:MAG TPA: pyridoxamine 5'-phosphate oxidase family protein [Hellea balneolensis]|uniref:Pyridoxamine 5'-phosphate oxidase family protein n=1 Tax=Hellea balneolensis TaxID=287478 RepID=A0A7C5R7P3_9PROT|nr:pyridoxamine 5'-phosphate oxidase family protein [Hellea balneolensis]